MTELNADVKRLLDVLGKHKTNASLFNNMKI